MYRLLYLLIIVLATSCGGSKKSSKRHKNEKAQYQENDVYRKAKKNNTEFSWIKGKMNVSGNDLPMELNVNFRIKKDSVIWMSANAAVVSVAKIKFTKDTVIILDNYNREYFAGNYAKINDSLKTNLSYSLVQSLLLGEFYPLYHDSTYTSCKDTLGVLYCTPKKEDIALALLSQNFVPATKPYHAIWMGADTNKVQRVYYYEPNKKVKIDVLYEKRENDEKQFPKETEVKMKGRDEKEHSLRLEFLKIDPQDKALDTEINIPQGYVRIK